MSKRAALHVLALSGSKITDLRSLAGLTELGQRRLDTPNIADLRPLSARQNLFTLERHDSAVADQRRLIGLTSLMLGGFGGGLDFDGTAASTDPTSRKLSITGREPERMRQLFTHMQNWQPPQPDPHQKQQRRCPSTSNRLPPNPQIQLMQTTNLM